MSGHASLGDRMKKYEAVYDLGLMPRSPLVVRVDGRAFLSFLRGAKKPFDNLMISSMIHAAQVTAREMQGFKLAYIQSDECTFVLTDYDDLNTQGWFDYRLSKVISIAASTFAVAFNYRYGSSTATFDARAFTMPIDDVPNVFVWRQQDWERNSVQMLTRSHFSHKQCHGKNIPAMHDMLHGIGVNWAHLDDRLKSGTYLTRTGEEICEKLSYDAIVDLIAIEEGEL